MIKALVFDMDGLLLDSERIVKRSWDKAGIEMGIPDIGKNIYHTLGLNRKARDEYFRKTYGTGFPLEDFNQRTSEIFFGMVEESGIPLKPGAKKLLEYAKEHGYKIAVATSTSQTCAVRELTDAGIWQFFDGGTFGDLVKNTKPDPEIYLKACESIGVAPMDCLALEDAPMGIRSARAAGLRVIVVPDLVQPDKESLALTYKKLNTLYEVIPLLKEE
ncbi:MAG: HAD family phosphatase [Dorea sp.]|nr:HAD family phosphatase [Dorea sp.]